MDNLLISAYIGSGMVMQRDKPFPICCKEEAKVSFLGKDYETLKVGDKWLVTLEPQQAGGPYEMEIKSKENTKVIKDIYIGDVWLCSGQSNMEMQMARLINDYSEEWETSVFPLVRQFSVPQEYDFSAPCEELSGGSWLIPSKENLQEFCAVPWFFAKNYYAKHKVPIGLIAAAWGGTPVESWMSREALALFPKIIADGDQYANESVRENISKTTSAAIHDWEKELLREDNGINNNWKMPQTDICDWDEITLPGKFSNAGLKDFCGAVWLAKDFEAAEFFKNKNVNVWLGTIVDSDIVFINGIEIGTTGYRYPPRKYEAKNIIKKGINRITIRVICNNGEGEVSPDKPFKIFTDNETIDLSGKWKYKVGAIAKTRPQEFFFQWQPMGCYNAMIAPVLKFPLKGVIWYQGESNESRPHEYEELFKNMICDWRKKNDRNLPFIFAQLPIYGVESDNNEHNRWPLIREAQANTLSLAATGMACTLELGEWNDIHPINKKDVGYRLFLAACKVVYGENNTSPGPVLQNKNEKIKMKNTGKIFIHFDNCGKGLTIHSPLPTPHSPHITVIDENNKYIRLPVEIDGTNQISIDLSTIINPKKILYAWADNPKDRLLINSDGLPMIPFRIEL